jgi:hypothetical protein
MTSLQKFHFFLETCVIGLSNSLDVSQNSEGYLCKIFEKIEENVSIPVCEYDVCSFLFAAIF